jgi:hypothetical protein
VQMHLNLKMNFINLKRIVWLFIDKKFICS